MNGKELLSFRINGDPHQVAVRPEQTLLEVVRDDLGLTGTKRGCDDASCGACTVLVDGEPVLSCVQLALLTDGAAITTIESAAEDRQLSAVQDSLVAEGGLQCGYCTPGMVLTTHALLRRVPDPDNETIRVGLSGNLCRCTGYLRIVEAVRHAAEPFATVNVAARVSELSPKASHRDR